MKKYILSLLLFAFCGTSVFAQNTVPEKKCASVENHKMCAKCENELVEKIDEYAQKVMKQWQLTGFSMAVSLDNKVIMSKGYGTKEMRPADGVGFKGARADDRSITTGGVKGVVNVPGSPIDANTLFQVGSISKSFTATVMSQLVDEGKLKWSDTVVNILPDFKMYDPWVTKNMQVKDIMTHRCGIGDQVGTYFPNLGYDREDIYKMLGRIKPAYSFRGDYQYNNITFIIAVKIIEKLTGKSWEENVEERVFKPLGMNRSSLDAKGFGNAVDGDAATPHDFSYRGKIETLPLYANEQSLYWLTVIGPAGGVNSTANDLIKYAQMHCNNGYLVNRNPDGSVKDTSFVMSRKAVNYLHRGLTITGQDSVHTNLYGQCWFVEQNNNYRLYFHTGTTWGMTALCWYVPQMKLCGVVLVNCEATSLPRYAIMRRTIDLVRKAPEPLKDWSSDYFTEWMKDSEKSWAESQEKEEKAKKEFAPELNKKIFAGKYVKDELFGDLDVTLEEGKLYICLSKKEGQPGFKNELVHQTGTKYIFRCDGHGFPVEFTMDAKGKNVTGLNLKFGYEEEDYFGGWKKASK